MFDLVGRVGMNVAEYVRMTVDEFVAHAVGYVGEVETSSLFAHFGVEDYMQQ